MEVDCIKSVVVDLSPKACQPKDASTKIELPAGQPSSTSTSEVQVQKQESVKDVSEIPHFSMEENVGRFKTGERNARLEHLTVWVPFLKVCRMIECEPNTNETCASGTYESDPEAFEPQFAEKFVENRHYVCAIGDVRH